MDLQSTSIGNGDRDDALPLTIHRRDDSLHDRIDNVFETLDQATISGLNEQDYSDQSPQNLAGLTLQSNPAMPTNTLKKKSITWDLLSKPIDQFHEKSIYDRRISALVKQFVSLLPTQGTVLDVGCGDGLLASLLQEQLPATNFMGIDVLLRPKTHIPVTPFDGITIPLPDNSVDTVMIVDVLHHTEDPAILIREAKRVARQWLVIKDHTKDGLLAYVTLRLMDWAGNARHGVALPYNYLTSNQWKHLFQQAGLPIESWRRQLNLYGLPLDWIFGRSLHFVGRLATGTK